MEDLAACLPPSLAGATITSLGPRASRAAVYRVDAEAGAYILKVSAAEDWTLRVGIQRLASDAGLAPRIVHVDDERHAVVTDRIEDRSLPALYANPSTRSAALAVLGQTLRRVHALPLPPALVAKDLRVALAELATPLASFAPGFATEAVRRVIDESPPACDRVVLSHNDVNPGNLVYDGARLLLIDDAGCRELLASYGEPGDLPARFLYDRRLVAALCGASFLQIARHGGHPGDAAAAPLPLGDFYQQLRAGALSIANSAGQWAFGLALLTHAQAL